MSNATHTTAAIIIIGAEVLSGKVNDENSPFLLRALRERGIDVKEIRTIDDDRDTIATAVRDTLMAQDIEIAMFEGITAGDKDFSSLITKLKQADVDYVYYGGYHPELGLILRQARQADLDATFMGPEGVGNKDINTIAGEAAEGLLVTLPPSFDQKEENQELVKAFTDKGEDPSGPFVLTSYAAVQVIAQGIEAADSTDPFEVADALRNGSFETPIGTIEYDEKGDMESFEFVVYEWHSDGSKTPVN